MKILTINVHAWLEKDSMAKIKKLAEVIEKKDYEIIALQEVNQQMSAEEYSHSNFIKPREEVNQRALKKDNYAGILIQELEKLGKNYYWSWTANHVGYDQYDEGLSILTKSKHKAKTISVSEETAYDKISNRNVLKATLNISGEEWIIFNGHFSWWKDSTHQYLFKKEWEKMKKYLKSVKKERVIFMGDFNNDAMEVSTGYDYILETTPYLKDSYQLAKIKKGHDTMPAGIDGWEEAKSGKRIDLIFVTEDIQVEESNVIFNGQNEEIISDHYGVEVTLKNE